MKFKASQNVQKESCRVHRYLHGYIRVIENRVHMQEIWNQSLIFHPHKHPHLTHDTHLAIGFVRIPLT